MEHLKLYIHASLVTSNADKSLNLFLKANVFFPGNFLLENQDLLLLMHKKRGGELPHLSTST